MNAKGLAMVQTTLSEGRKGEDVTGVLIGECRDVGQQIAQLRQIGEKVLSTVTALLALAATVAIGGEKAYLLMGVPLLLTVVFGYVLVAQTDLVALGSYKAALEQQVNERCGAPVMQWESHIVRSGHARLQQWIMRILTLLVALIGSAGALAVAWNTREAGNWGHEHSAFYLYGTFASIAAELLVLVLLFVANRLTRERVLRSVKSSFEVAGSRPSGEELGTS